MESKVTLSIPHPICEGEVVTLTGTIATLRERAFAVLLPQGNVRYDSEERAIAREILAQLEERQNS